MEIIRSFWEYRIFGLCSYWGRIYGISSNRIRLFFIYLSFVTFGSPIIFYLMAAFILNIKNYIRRKVSLFEF